MASSQDNIVDQLYNEGVIEALLCVLENDKSNELIVLAIWALSNIANESVVYRDILLQNNCQGFIINKLLNTHLSVDQVSTLI